MIWLLAFLMKEEIYFLKRWGHTFPLLMRSQHVPLINNTPLWGYNPEIIFIHACIKLWNTSLQIPKNRSFLLISLKIQKHDVKMKHSSEFLGFTIQIQVSVVLKYDLKQWCSRGETQGDGVASLFYFISSISPLFIFKGG